MNALLGDCSKAGVPDQARHAGCGRVDETALLQQPRERRASRPRLQRGERKVRANKSESKQQMVFPRCFRKPHREKTNQTKTKTNAHSCGAGRCGPALPPIAAPWPPRPRQPGRTREKQKPHAAAKRGENKHAVVSSTRGKQATPKERKQIGNRIMVIM